MTDATSAAAAGNSAHHPSEQRLPEATDAADAPAAAVSARSTHADKAQQPADESAPQVTATAVPVDVQQHNGAATNAVVTAAATPAHSDTSAAVPAAALSVDITEPQAYDPPVPITAHACGFPATLPVWPCKRSSAGRRHARFSNCLLYTSPSPRDRTRSRMPSSA